MSPWPGEPEQQGRNVIPHLRPPPLPRGSDQNTREEPQVFPDTVPPLWDTAVPHHEIKQDPGLAQPRNLCLIFPSCGRNLCPPVTEAQGRSGASLPLALHPGQRVQLLTGGALGPPCTLAQGLSPET